MSLIDDVIAKNPYDPSIAVTKRGYWKEAASAVAGLVRKGFPVSEAVRRVLDHLEKPQEHFASLRAAYYNYYGRRK